MPKFAPSRSGVQLLRFRVVARVVLAAGAVLVAVSSALVAGGTPASPHDRGSRRRPGVMAMILSLHGGFERRQTALDCRAPCARRRAWRSS
jgi:hypothetical protein